MKRVFPSWASAGALLVLWTTPQQPTFRAGVEVVSVDVSVNEGGHPIAGLTSGDFNLLDNGVPQHVDAASIATVPLDVSLVVDTSFLETVSRSLRPFKADAQAIADLLRAEDRVRVVACGNTVEEVLPLESATASLPMRDMPLGGGASVKNALLYTLTLPTPADRRQLVVVFTDGSDTSSVLSNTRLVDLAGRTDAVLHAVFRPPYKPPGGEPPSITPAVVRASRAAITDAAVRTGGESHELADAVTAFKSIFEDFKQSYVLSYTPSGVPQQGWHEIKVTLKRPGNYAIRARKGYAGR